MDLSKYNIPSLNRPEALDARKSSQFWPSDLGHNGKLAVLGCRFQPADGKENKTDKFVARVKVVASDNPNALNREYSIGIPCRIDPKYQHLADNTRANFFAACMGANAEVKEGEKPFDCDKAQQEMIDADENGELSRGECVIFHRAVSRTKDTAVIENGVAKVVQKQRCNHYFSPVV